MLLLWSGACAAPPWPSTRYEDLLQLFTDWREFQKPKFVDGVPDYGAAAMIAQHRRLAGYQQRLTAIDPAGWPVPQQVDYHLVRAEMNGLDFDHRVLRPWARDPSFYVIVHTAQSDTPAHEGTWVHGAIEVWAHQFPVSGERLADLQTTLRAAPALLEQAKKTLVGHAKDLWSEGVRTARGQSAALSALAERLATTQPELVPDVRRAQSAADDFGSWLDALYLRQPAYGTSYLIGKLQIDRLIADRAREQGEAFTLRQFMDDFQAAGLIPVSLIRWQMTNHDDEMLR